MILDTPYCFTADRELELAPGGRGEGRGGRPVSCHLLPTPHRQAVTAFRWPFSLAGGSCSDLTGMCVHAHIHTYTHTTCTRARAHTRAHTDVHMHTQTCVLTSIDTCTSTDTLAHRHTCTRTHVHTCSHTRTHMHTYTHADTCAQAHTAPDDWLWFSNTSPSAASLASRVA